MHSLIKFLASATFASGLACAGVAHAKEPRIKTLNQTAPFDGAEVLSPADLGQFSGGTAIGDAILTDQDLLALVQGNSVTGANVWSGNISLGANSFTGFEGIGNFVINTGHNNALQSSLNVSILAGGE